MEPKTKTLLLILVSFILGLVGGIVVDRYYISAFPGHRQSRGDPKKEFTQRLKLDSIQTAQVDSLMTAHRAKMEDVRKLFLASRDSLRMDIRRHLSDEQKKLYDDLIKEMESRDSRRREGEKPQPKQ
jgi:hypothetical protein